MYLPSGRNNQAAFWLVADVLDGSMIDISQSGIRTRGITDAHDRLLDVIAEFLVMEFMRELGEGPTDVGTPNDSEVRQDRR
jgi:hypothetical protein